MAEHPNAARCRRMYEILAEGDMDEVRELLAPDIVWHVPGRGKNAGPKRGIDEVMAFFGAVGWEPGVATFSIELRDVVADDRHMAALVHYDHKREGARFDQDGVELMSLDAAGKIKEFWAFLQDSASFDEFFG